MKELVTIYSKDKDLIESLGNSIKDLTKKFNIDLDILEDYLEDNILVEKIPLSIFRSPMPPLEAVVLYLKNLGYPIFKIAKLLNRDNRTIWTTYNNAKDKKLNLSSQDFIPIAILANRRYSILENISHYLKNSKKLTFKEIGILLNKSNKTIWTVYNRHKIKQNN